MSTPICSICKRKEAFFFRPYSGEKNCRGCFVKSIENKVRATIAEFKSQGIPITDTKFFTYETGPTPTGGFIVTATTTEAFGPAGGWVKYIYEPGKGGRWTNDGDPMPHDMYEPAPPSHSPPIFAT